MNNHNIATMKLRRRWLSCIVLLSCFLANSNNTQIDKDSLLKKEYKTLKRQYSKLRNNNPKKAKVYVDAIITKALQDQNAYEEHNAYIFQCALEGYFGNHEKALSYIDKTIAYSKKENNSKLLAYALNQKGIAYYVFGKYDKAVLYYLKVDSLAYISKDIRTQIAAKHNIASLKMNIGDYKGAYELFQINRKDLPLIKNEKTRDKHDIKNLIGLASTATYIDTEAAKVYNTEVKKISEKLNHIDALSYYYIIKGIISYQELNYDDAIDTFRYADSIVQKLERKRGLYPIYRFQGKSFHDMKMYDEAICSFEKILDLKEDIRFNHFELQEIFSLLASSYQQKGNIDKALENFELALDLAKKNDALKSKLNSEIFEGYNTKILQEKIQSLTEDSEKATKQSSAFMYIAISLLMLSFFLIIRHKIVQKNNNNKLEKLLAKLNEKEVKNADNNPKPRKVIADEKVACILSKLEAFEKGTLYLNKNVSLVFVAKKLNTNTTYLSKVINEHKGLTFSKYITYLRIEYALLRLKNDKTFRSYSVKGIAEELGFKSEGVFSRAFKKHTSLYPSFYIKKLTSDL